MKKFRTNDRVHHRKFGFGTIINTDEIERSIVKVEFDGTGRKRIYVESNVLSRVRPVMEASIIDEEKEEKERIAKTFAKPDPGDAHDYFIRLALLTKDADQFINKNLFDLIQQSKPVVCWGSSYNSPYKLKPDEAEGLNLVSPTLFNGIVFVLRIDGESDSSELVDAYPWHCEGIKHEVLIEKVYPWSNGLEAHIAGEIKGIQVTFFDSLYARHKNFYKSGSHDQFMLAGFAYYCTVIEPETFEITNPEYLKLFRSNSYEDSNSDRSIKVKTGGMASLIHMEEYDRDDYLFRGPVKSVEEAELNDRKVWKIRTTVLRSSDCDDIDLDIFVDETVLENEALPKPGDDIAGSLWLQGYMVYPGKILRSD